MFNICCTCLKDINKLKAVYLNKTEDVVKQLKYVLPEITLEPEIPVYICSTCQTKLHSFCIFKKQSLENYGRCSKLLQESGNAKNQSFIILQTDIKNIKEENQIYGDISNEASKDFNDQIHFITVEDITEKEGTVTLVQDEIFSPGLNKNINEDSDMTDVIKSCKCKEQHDQTNICIEDNNYIEEDIIKFEDSEEPNLYQKLLSDIKKESNSEQDIHKNETTNSNANKLVCAVNNCNKMKSFECNICNKQFANKYVLKRHIKIHADIKNFECSICEKKFKRNDILNQHMKTHTGVKDFECSICEKKFKRNILNQHMKTHTGHRTNTYKDFECSICKKKFLRKFSLNMHMKIHTGVKDFECPICEKNFIYKGNLNMHMKAHTGVKNFECSICENKFLRKYSLNMHMKIHTGVKDFQCSICEKNFMLKCSLNQHMKTHTGVKDFECSFCEKKFSQKSTLYVHITTHSDVKDFECNNCNKKFVNKKYLTKHLKLRCIKNKRL